MNLNADTQTGQTTPPTKDNVCQYMDALENMYQSLILAEGGLIGQNTLVKLIDFWRNREITIRHNEFFRMHGFKRQDLPMLDFIDAAAGWERQHVRDTEAYHKGEFPIPYTFFLSDGKQLEKRLNQWSLNPLRAPAQLVYENGSAAGHNGSLVQRDEAMQQIWDLLKNPHNYKATPKYLAAGGMGHGRHLVSAICKYYASGVQIGSRFTTSKESSAHDYHKQLIIDSKKHEGVSFSQLNIYSEEARKRIIEALKGDLSFIGPVPSTSGMYATGARTKLILDILAGEERKDLPVFRKLSCCGPNHKETGCLVECGHSDYFIGQNDKSINDTCIEKVLRNALSGKPDAGLFFMGKYSNEIPETEINTPVRKIFGNIYLEAYEEIMGNSEVSELAAQTTKRLDELKSIGIDSLTHRLFTYYSRSRYDD